MSIQEHLPLAAIAEIDRSVTVRCDGRILLIRTAQIEWLSAERNSVRLHMADESIALKTTLERMENQLATDNFVRVHRSAIVNLSHIRELRHWHRGTYHIILKNGKTLLLSRSYRDRFFQVVGQPLG